MPAGESTILQTFAQDAPTIGVLGLQGAYQAHVRRLQALGANTRLIYSAEELDEVDGLVIPGGESTTMLRFLTAESGGAVKGSSVKQKDAVEKKARVVTPLETFTEEKEENVDTEARGPNLWRALQTFVTQKPVLGTCAGLILLARAVAPDQPSLGALDVSVQRNAYGRQRNSRIVYGESNFGGEPMEMVFIRAPMIECIGPDVEVLACRDEHPVLVQQGNIIGCAFHPELGHEIRIHQHLLALCG